MKTFDLKLTLEQIRLLLAGAGELPTKVGMPLSLEIDRQVAEQMRKEAAASKAAEAASKPVADSLTHEANPYPKPPNGHAEAALN